MSCIFEIPCRVYLFSIPLLVQIDTSMATHNSTPQVVDGKDPVPRRRYRNYGDDTYGTPHRSLQPSFAQRGETLSFNSLVAPVFLLGKVNFLPYPFLYDTSILDLSRPFGSLNLEDREPCDTDESADRHTRRERGSSGTDDTYNHTDYPSDRHSPPSANTRSHHRQGSDEGGSPPQRWADSRSFNPYGPPKSTLEINNAIKDLLLRHHAGADEGYVYGFHHPDDVALDRSPLPGGHDGRPQLIKIGRSRNHQARMRQISKRCGYVPHTVFAHHMPHHATVERIVHTQLHNSRLRDAGCAGCGTRHEEWFQTGVARAEHLVALWKTFAESHSYDDQGEMLPVWRERLEQLDLGDADCWEDFVHGATLARTVARSPQELEAETAPVGLVVDHVSPSSDRNLGNDDQEESWEVV